MLNRVVEFVGLDSTDEQIAHVVDLTNFKTVQSQSDVILNESPERVGTSKSFFHKGTNGRWKEVLSDDDLALYQQTAQQILSPDCIHWLEMGKMMD